MRAAFLGLGRIYDLNVRALVDNPDVEVVALVDPSGERRDQRQADWPNARTFTSVADLAASGLDVDAVVALLPIPLHTDGVVELLDHGWHVKGSTRISSRDRRAGPASHRGAGHALPVRRCGRRSRRR